MNTDWTDVGKVYTEGVEHEFSEMFSTTEWKRLPVETGFYQGFAFNEIIERFGLKATHVGEISYSGGMILAVRTKYKQGIAEVFCLDNGGAITPLAIQKYWED